MELLAAGTRVKPDKAAGIRALLAVLLILGATSMFAETTPSKEYQLKAVFLFNFAMFVDWPPTAFPDVTAPFVIGVLGEDPFGPYLDEVVHGEKIRDRPVEVRRYRDLSEVDVCHILFINRAAAVDLRKVAGALSARHILTVGETDDSVRKGGVIAFAVKDGKIRLKVNMAAADASGLTISSKLLRAAEVTDNERN